MIWFNDIQARPILLSLVIGHGWIIIQDSKSVPAMCDLPCAPDFIIQLVRCSCIKNRYASKTEFIWLGSTCSLARCTFDPIIISGVPIQPSSTVRDLGAYIEYGMSYTDHVTRLTRTCFFRIRPSRSIRRSLTVNSSYALVRVLILTRLDYCNGLLGEAPKCLLSGMQLV